MQSLNTNFLVAEKSGWLDKKGKRRWFVLKQGELSWYDQPRQHERGEKPNGSIMAKDASVAQIGEVGNGMFTSLAKEHVSNSHPIRLLCICLLYLIGQGEQRISTSSFIAE